MEIPFSEPWITEEEAKAVYQTVKKKMLRYGTNVKEFERMVSNYIGVEYGIAVSSGTAALHVALKVLNIGKKDEVIIPSFSCAPPAIATLLVNAKPVFVDIEEETLNIDIVDAEKKINEKTKAIIPIHYAGHPPELKELVKMAQEHDLFLIEDIAEALGSLYYNEPSGKFGILSVTAFSPNKIITTGEGGMILTNSEELAEKSRIVSDYGQKERFLYVSIGNNYHMTELQAAIGVVQMKKINEIINRRRKIAKIYNELLENVEGIYTPSERKNTHHVYMSYYILVNPKKREKLRNYLEKNGIRTRVYFPPLHTQPAYRKYVSGKLVNTEKISRMIINLPIYPTMKYEEIEYVVNKIKDFFS